MSLQPTKKCSTRTRKERTCRRTVEFTATNSIPAGFTSFNNLTINGGTTTLGVGTTLNGNLTISSGTLDVSATSFALSVKGNWTNNASFTQRSGTVTFSGTANQTLGGSASTTFNNLTISNSGADGANFVTLARNTTVSAALSITDGVFTQGASLFTLTTGAVTISSGGRLSNTGTGNLTLNGTTTSITVNSGGEWDNFGSAPTITLAGNVSNAGIVHLDGAGITCGDAAKILLRSSVSGTARTWSGAGTYTMQDLDVKDQNQSGVTITAYNSTNSGNTNWTFAGGCAPTACKLESFAASRSDDGVVLEWRTGYEVNNVGFNVYREDQTGKLVRLTPHLVAGSALMVRRGTPLTAGLSYSWSDPEPKAGELVRYWLEDLDVSGQSTWNGPFVIDENRRPTRPPSPGRGRSVMISALNAQQAEQQEQQAHQPVGQLESTAKARKVTIAAQVQAASLAGNPAVKISVKQEGWYRVGQPQLLAAGLNAAVDPRRLQLSVDGQHSNDRSRGEGWKTRSR